MKKIFLMALCSVTVLSGFSQKTFNDPNAEKRNVSGFHAISVGGGIDLYLSKGTETVAVSASDTKYRDRIRTEVVDGVLKIGYEYREGVNLVWGDKRLRAYVSYAILDQLTASGGSDVIVDGEIASERLKLRLSGGSDFKGKVNTKELEVGASGGSDVNISGNAGNLKIDASGGSDFKGYELITDICNLEASGGSDIYITVNKEMTANASGGSDVYYKGNGLIRDLRTSGSSGVHKSSR